MAIADVRAVADGAGGEATTGALGATTGDGGVTGGAARSGSATGEASGERVGPVAPKAGGVEGAGGAVATFKGAGGAEAG